jgi:hypothetical protein
MIIYISSILCEYINKTISKVYIKKSLRISNQGYILLKDTIGIKNITRLRFELYYYKKANI